MKTILVDAVDAFVIKGKRLISCFRMHHLSRYSVK